MFRIISLYILILALSGLAQANPVLRLVISTKDGTVTNGSAVLINRSTGCFATNQHLSIFGDLPQLKLTIETTTGYFTRKYNATVRWEHPQEDLALICVKPDEVLPPSAKRGVSADTWYTTKYTARGYPHYAEGFREAAVSFVGIRQTEPIQPRETLGTAKRLAQLGVSKHPVVLSDTNLTVVSPTDEEDGNQKFGGFSGGGVFDTNNKLIGIIARGDSGRNLLYAIPVERIPRQFFEEDLTAPD